MAIRRWHVLCDWLSATKRAAFWQKIHKCTKLLINICTIESINLLINMKFEFVGEEGDDAGGFLPESWTGSVQKYHHQRNAWLEPRRVSDLHWYRDNVNWTEHAVMEIKQLFLMQYIQWGRDCWEQEESLRKLISQKQRTLLQWQATERRRQRAAKFLRKQRDKNQTRKLLE